MNQAITIRLTKELAEWLTDAARHAGMKKQKFILSLLEKERTGAGARPYMRLAGSVKAAPRNLSARKGFSRE
jgi:hypothetical protein